MATLKRTEQPSRTNVFIDLIEDMANTTAENVTVTKESDRRYRVSIDDQVIGWVSGQVGRNYKPFGSTLQVRLADSVKWSIEMVGAQTIRKTSARSRVEAIYSLVADVYNA